jgi:hypothetical protein
MKRGSPDGCVFHSSNSDAPMILVLFKNARQQISTALPAL